MQRTIERATWTTASLIGAAAWFQPSVAGSDLWWHLAAGRETVALGGPQTVDHFSFTFAGQRLHTPEWLWGALCWSIYRISPDAVAVASFVVLLVVFALALVAARRHSGSPAAACIAMWAAAATCHWFLDIRPHVITLLFAVFIVVTRDRWWARWVWAPVIAVWCNMHGSFVFGVGAIGLIAVVETFEASHAERRLRIDPTLWLGVVLACVASLSNPWGWRVYEYPLAFVGKRSPFLGIVEWTAPPFSIDPRYFSGRFVWLLAVVGAGAVLELTRRARRGRRGGDVYLVMLAIVTGLMAVTSRRFIPLFALTAVPLAAGLGGALITTAGRRLPGRVTPYVGGACSAVALAIGLLLWRDVRLVPRPFDRWTQSYSYPAAAVRYARALDAGPRVMNYYNWGGYIMLHAPELKVMIDGRGNLLYGDEAYADYQFLMSNAANFHARLGKYAPDVAIIPAGPLAGALAAPPYGWTQAYADGLAAVLLPPGSVRLQKPLPDPDDVVGDEPQWQVARAEILTGRGQPALARELIERALRRDPLFAPGYGALANSHARELRLEGIGAAIARGVAAEPRYAGQLHHMEALAYMQANAPAHALRALELAIAHGPFTASPSAQDVERLRAFVDARPGRR